MSGRPSAGCSAGRLPRRDLLDARGYQAGVCRTAVVQPAPPHAERIWANLVECKYLIIDMIKPGASCRAIYEAFMRKLSELDLPPISFVGHGIGLHLHEDPYLGKYSDTPLEAGMVLGIEPLVYRTPYGFGMQNKDMVLVTETGSELLSDYANTDTLLDGAVDMSAMAVKTVAILGAGHGGCAAAADLTRRGFAVRLHARNAERLAPLRERGGIEARGCSRAWCRSRR